MPELGMVLDPRMETFLAACYIPSGPDDLVALAHNKYAECLVFGRDVDGHTAREWREEEDRLAAGQPGFYLTAPNDEEEEPADA